MDAQSALLPAAILTALMGATIIITFQFVMHRNDPKPYCMRCGHTYEYHEQRFGDPGVCKLCVCFRFER